MTPADIVFTIVVFGAIIGLAKLANHYTDHNNIKQFYVQWNAEWDQFIQEVEEL